MRPLQRRIDDVADGFHTHTFASANDFFTDFWKLKTRCSRSPHRPDGGDAVGGGGGWRRRVAEAGSGGG